MGILFASSSSAGYAIGVIFGILLLGGIGVLIYFYFTNDSVKRSLEPIVDAFADLFSSHSTINIQRIPDEYYHQVMSNIGWLLTRNRFVPVNQAHGLYVYQREDKASCLMGLILLLICLIPGILYLALGGKTRTATVRVSSFAGGYTFSLDAPGGIKRKISKMLEPYKIEA